MPTRNQGGNSSGRTSGFRASFNAIPRRFYGRFPLFDRYTYFYDSQYNIWSGLFAGIVLPMQGLLARSLGATPFMIALMLSSTFIGFLLNLLAGHEAAKRPKVKYAVQILVAARLAPVFAVFVRDAWGFVAISCVFNLFENLSGVAYRSIQKINYSSTRRPKVLGETAIILNVFIVTSSYIASLVYDAGTLNLRFMYPLASILGLTGVWRLSRIKVRFEKKVPPVENTGNFLSSLRLFQSNRMFLFFMLAMFVLAFGNKIGEAIDPFRVRDELKINYKDANYAFSIALNLAQIIGMAFWAWLASRFNTIRLLAISGIFITARPIALALASGPIHLITGMALYGFGVAGSALLPVLIIYNLCHDDRRLSNYLGVHYFMVGVRGMIGPYIGAHLLEIGVRTVSIYFLNAGIIAAGVILMYIVSRSAIRAGKCTSS